MTDGRYVVVEFHGGPKDGLKALFEFPPHDSWFFPLPGAANEPRHVYRIADQQNFEVLHLDDAEIQELLADQKQMLESMGAKRAMVFEYQGVGDDEQD